MRITVEDLLCLVHVEAYNIESLKGKSIAGVSTDSRAINGDELFVAIRGDKFDGNKFVGDAFEKGALCAVIEQHAQINQFRSKPFIVVNDTTKALGRLANLYRKKFDIPVIAIAGSNGKTYHQILFLGYDKISSEPKI